ncbi:hypothetical protein [Phenylobacterium sp.]|jgi:predicted metalloprotease with PDZ domain|uniref:M61 family metallopeptidase n=1 Tax=Phenylobacterium sp. TaxID=1871053 RepID=UPI002F3F2DD9
MRWLTAIAVLVLGAAAARAQPAPSPPAPTLPTPTLPTPVQPHPVLPDPVAYRLSPVMAGDKITALKVEIRFHEGPSGRSRLAWARTGEDDRLWRFARDVRIEGGEATADGPGAWVVHAAPGTPITASYRVVSAYGRDPTDDNSHQTWPVIRPDWFFALGEGLFATPEDHDKSPATFEWAGAPRSLFGIGGFGFASDLEHLAGPGRKATRPGTVDDIQESVVIGGRDVRLIEKRVDNVRLRVAIVGRYNFADKDFAAKVFEILAAERAFWGEKAKPYLVAMSPTLSVGRRLSMNGRGRSDAFALWVDPASDQLDLRWLLAHEYFHTWNPVLLGSLPDGPTEPLGFWFSEGFTDYYAWKLMLAAGQFGPADFAARWNETLARYAISPLKAAPNTVVMTNFWVNQYAQKLPYYRGAILAATLDTQARAHGSSLDAVMREMRRMAAVKGETRHAAELFPAAYQAVTGIDPRPLIQRHMIDGEPIDLPRGALGACFAVETVQVAAFDRGWDPDATRAANMTLAGVKPGGPAYAAGLRDGMRLLEIIAAEPGDASHPYVLKVKPPGEADQVISYLPAGTGTVSRQTVTPVAAPGCPAPPVS